MRYRHLLIARIAFASLWGTIAVAQETDETERIRQIEAQMETNERSAEELRQTTQQQEEELARLRLRLIETADALREAERDATAIEARLADLTAEEDRLTDLIITQQQDISDVLAGLQSLEMARPPALVVSPEDASRAARIAMVLSTMIERLNADVETLKANIADIEAVREDMDAERRALRLKERELQARQVALEDGLVQKESEFSQVTARMTELQRQNARLAEEATNIRDVVTRLEDNRRTEERLATEALRSDRANEDATLARRPALDQYYRLPDAFNAAKGKVPFPVSGLVTAKYGERDADGERLDGLIIQTRGGAVVTAPFNATVAFAREVPLIGNMLILDVGSGYRLVLVGLSRFSINEGGQVRAGEPLGRMPEDNAREDLFFQIRLNREPIDPLPWLLQNS